MTPASAARSGTRGRLPLGTGGNSGSTAAQRSPGTSGAAIAPQPQPIDRHAADGEVAADIQDSVVPDLDAVVEGLWGRADRRGEPRAVGEAERLHVRRFGRHLPADEVLDLADAQKDLPPVRNPVSQSIAAPAAGHDRPQPRVEPPVLADRAVDRALGQPGDLLGADLVEDGKVVPRPLSRGQGLGRRLLGEPNGARNPAVQFQPHMVISRSFAVTGPFSSAVRIAP